MGVSRQKVIQTAEKLVARGRLQAAISEYRKVLESAPNDTSMLNRVGDLYARLNQVDKATRLFRQTAENFARQGFFVKAIAIYKKIIRLDPSQIAAYESLAGLYGRQGLTNEAMGQYQVVADYFLKHGDRTAAAGIYRSMIDVDTENPRYRLRLAGLLQEAGDLSGALEQYHEIASLMLAHGRIEEAAQVYTSALDVDSTDTRFLARAAKALREAGHASGAERLFDLVAERSADTAAAARAELERALGSEEARAGEAPEVETGRPFWMVEAAAEEEPEARGEVASALEEASAGGEALVLDLDSAELEGDELGAWMDMPAVPLEAAGAAEQPATDEAADFEFELEVEEPTAEPDEELVVEEQEAEEQAPAAEVETDEPAIESEEEPAAVAVAGAEAAQEVPAAGPPGPETPDARPTEIADRARDLLIEATVLSKYGMDEMAVACLEETLELDPDHVEAQGRLIHLQISLGRRDEALIMANRFAGLVAEGGEPAIWAQVVERMGEEGFDLAEGRFVAPALPETEEPGAVATPEEGAFEQPEEWAEEVEEAVRREALAGAEGRAAEAVPEASSLEPDELEAAAAAEERAVEAEPELAEAVEPVEELAADAEPERAEEERPRPEEGRGEVEIDTRRDILDIATTVRRRPSVGGRAPAATPGELLAGAEELIWEGEESPAEPPRGDLPEEAAARVAGGAAELPPDLDLAAMAEELEAAAERFAASLGPTPSTDEPAPPFPADVVERAGAAEAVWSDEKALGADEFFDLATELEAELLDAEMEDDLLPPVQEQTIEEIVEGFRRGMEKSLSPEDYDTHYNLGIAYQEMGLVDEAIGEFQLAAKDSRYLVECCSLLAGCFQSKGYPELAVHWYERGLASPSVREDERLGLLYELGNLEIAIGARERARERFVELYGISSTYRDVVAKLEELGRRPS
jgi:tetratricopeptide (TPR) repeat protein